MMLLRLYSDCLSKALRALSRSPWTLLLPIAFALVLAPIQSLVAPLGFAGGFALVLIYDAMLASFLYVISELVRGSSVRLKEMPQSMKPYFWPIMNVLFVLWIARLLGSLLLQGATLTAAFRLAVGILVFVLLNAVPEVIYQKNVYSGIATLQGSIEFIHEHWIEWFIPNVLFGAALFFGLPLLGGLPFAGLVLPLIAGAFVHAAMVFRGFLFSALDGTTARQRELRYRLGR